LKTVNFHLRRNRYSLFPLFRGSKRGTGFRRIWENLGRMLGRAKRGTQREKLGQFLAQYTAASLFMACHP